MGANVAKWLCLSAVLCLLVSSGAAPPAFGVDGGYPWSDDGEVLRKLPGPNNLSHSRVVSDGNGGGIFVWQHDHYYTAQPFTHQIEAQRLDYDGNNLWGSSGVLVSVKDLSKGPECVADGSGGAIVVWLENVDSVYAQKMSAGGVCQWGASGKPIGSAAGSNVDLQVCPDFQGGAYVGWEDRLAHISGAGVISAPGVGGIELIPGSGNGPYKMISSGPVLGLPGGVYAAWENPSGEVRVQKVFAGLQWGPSGIWAGSAGSDPFSNYDLALDGSGGLLVCWVQRNGAYPVYTYKVKVQRFNSYGTALWTSGGVTVADEYSSGGQCSAPVVAKDGGGGAYIAWVDTRNASISIGTQDVFAQRVDENGVVQWQPGGVLLPPYLVGDTAPGDQWAPKILSDLIGGSIVAYNDLGAWSSDISATRLNAVGKIWSKWIYWDGTSHSDPGLAQHLTGIAFDGSGPDPKGMLMSWEDHDGVYHRIIGQKISIDLNPTPPCALDPKFQTGTLAVGMAYYTDRAYTLTSVPSRLAGLPAVKTPNDERLWTQASDYLAYAAASDETVFVAYDRRGSVLPAWMAGFAPTGETVGTSLSTQGHLDVYAKAYSSGDCVNLGANMAAPAGGDYSNYLVFHGNPPPSCSLAPKFQTGTLAVGMAYYTDRAYTLTSVPSRLAGLPAVKTPNDERLWTQASDYLAYTAASDETVFVAYDQRGAGALPAWMAGFAPTGETIGTSLSTQGHLDVYAKAYSSGDCVNLGANMAPPASGAYSNYLVIHGNPGAPPCSLDPRFQNDILRTGMTYYTDRDYTLAAVPSAYAGMRMLKTPNDDRSLSGAAGYLAFEMLYDDMVYVAYDQRGVAPPAWMGGFVYTGNAIATSLAAQGYLKVYGKSFLAGDCVNLGGNMAAPASGSYSNYIVFHEKPVALPCGLNSRFAEAVLGEGEEYYTDRAYTIASVPAKYAGLPMIKAPNDDRLMEMAGDYLRFQSPGNATVYVAYDRRGSASLPAWMAGFAPTGETIGTTLASQGHMDVYARNCGPGDCVNLGANLAPPASGAYSNFFVFVE